MCLFSLGRVQKTSLDRILGADCLETWRFGGKEADATFFLYIDYATFLGYILKESI